MFTCRYQNAGRGHNINIDNISFERAEQFTYFGTTLTNQRSIEEESRSGLNSGNACYHSVRNFLSSTFLSKNIKTDVYSNLNFACCFVGV